MDVPARCARCISSIDKSCSFTGSIRQPKGYHWFGHCYITCEATAALSMEGADSLVYTAPPSAGLCNHSAYNEGFLASLRSSF